MDGNRATHRACVVRTDAAAGAYSRYAAQGGDWGSAGDDAAIGVQDPKNCIGIHLNMPITRPDPATANDMTEKEKVRHRRGMQYYNDWDSGYSEGAEHLSTNCRLWAD